MELTQFFREGFVSDELANALLELGQDESGTKTDLVNRLAIMQKPLGELLGAFYDQALANACGKFGLPIKRKPDNVTRLVAFVRQPHADGQVAR